MSRMMEKKSKKSTVILALAVFTIVFAGIVGTGSRVEAAKKQPYKIKGTTITVKAKKNSDITAALDAALVAARDKGSSRKMTVVVPKGTYKINEKGLHIYSNTTLDLSKGVTLKYSGRKSHPMLMSGINGNYKGRSDYNNSKLCRGYKGFKNITIKGGTWINKNSNTSNTIRLFHAKNVTLEGVTFSGGGGAHQAEVAAIDGFYVRNCTFKNFGNNGQKKSRKLEALQMDIPCSKDVYPSVYEDGTLMKNVEITGCTFSNVPRGVGTHTLLNGAYFKNIKITNNTFENIAEEAIVGLNYMNCEITNNTITDCGAGILFQFFKATPESIMTTVFDGKKAYKGKIQHNANTVISNNTIKTKYSKSCDEVQGIKVYGLNVTNNLKGRDKKKIPKGNYYISGVTVENNSITTAGYGIHMMDTRDSVVRNNTIIGSGVAASDSKKDKYDGVLVENYAQNTQVTDNVIQNMQRNGIFVQTSAYVSAIDGNKITGCGKSGISFYDNSGITNNLTNNTIDQCELNGIYLNETCEVNGSIINNQIGTVAKNGIWIAENSKVVESIASNSIQSAGGNGIMVYNKSSVGRAITGNTVVKSDRGIFIAGNSVVAGGISGNTVSGIRKDISVDDTSQAVITN